MANFHLQILMSSLLIFTQQPQELHLFLVDLFQLHQPLASYHPEEGGTTVTIGVILSGYHHTSTPALHVHASRPLGWALDSMKGRVGHFITPAAHRMQKAIMPTQETKIARSIQTKIRSISGSTCSIGCCCFIQEPTKV